MNARNEYAKIQIVFCKNMFDRHTGRGYNTFLSLHKNHTALKEE